MQKSITQDLKEVCSALLEEHKKTNVPLRFPELIKANKITLEEATSLKSRFAWSKEQNCHEIVIGVAYDLPVNEITCPITSFPIHLSNALYRLYTNDEIQHRCFNPKIKKLSSCKWNWKLKTDYEFDALEAICEQSTAHKILKCPMLINHCYNWAARNNLDINNICNPAEAHYLWKHKLTTFPVCEVTGEKLKFSGNCYPKHSKKGANILNSRLQKNKTITEEQKQKTKKTNLVRYGVGNVLDLEQVRKKGLEKRRQHAEFQKLLKEIKNKINPPPLKNEKYKQTMTERYGGPSMKFYLEKHPKTEQKIKETTAKAKLTWLKKYGVDNPTRLPEIKEKRKQTNLEKYGVSHYFCTEESKQQRSKIANIKTYKNFQRFADYCTPEFTLEEWLKNTKQIFKWKLTENGSIFEARYWGYAPVGSFSCSSLERQIHKFLEKHKIKFIKNDRMIISPFELDIFVLGHNIAIECNGEFFHSAKRLTKEYHENKRITCENKGIRLLQFFGNELVGKSKITNSILKNAMQLNRYKIFARKTEVRTVFPSTARMFYEKYHLHGFCGALQHYGLFLRGRLVQMMSIGNNRFSKKQTSDLEIIRSATIFNFNVIGGVSKLISAIKSDYKNKAIHTYVDRTCFSGVGYEKAGFAFKGITEPSYFYFKGDRYPIISRYQAQKHKLKKLLGDKFDPNKTEEENMTNAGYSKVFRCSHKHLILKSNA